MKRSLLFSLVLLGALSLSGCKTEEMHRDSDIDTTLDFYPQHQPKNVTENTEATPPQSINPKKMYTSAPALSIDSTKSYSATLKTAQGNIIIQLKAKEVPQTVNNFVFLSREKFYDGTIFHRTINGFMIQGGDPEGTGRGGPGYRFPDEEFEGEYTRGTVAMANVGPDTNGSQFFIMQKDTPLPPNYVIFGQVTEGMEVVDAIATAPTAPGGEGSSPVNPTIVESVEILEQ